jgi:sporulation protein YabP
MGTESVESAVHRLTLEDRSQLRISGVSDVESFDEETVILVTVRGTLVIRGEQLHLQMLSLEGGQVIVDGKVNALLYEDDGRENAGFFSRLFR